MATTDSTSLDMQMSDDGIGLLVDLIEDENSISPSEAVSQILQREKIEELFDIYLSEREIKILKLRFGLEDSCAHTLDEIGEQLGVTRERVRQLEKQAIQKIKEQVDKEKKEYSLIQHTEGKNI